METLEYVGQKFGVDIKAKPPIEIKNINRPIMAQTLNELGFKAGAEIGVAQGDHAKLLCDSIPGLKLYCVDVWHPYPEYNEYRNRIERYYEIAKKKLEPYNCTLINKFSVDASKDIADGSLDFVYIDGGHDFLNVTLDLCHWIPKVRLGGIVFGHDYKRTTNPEFRCHVQDVICAYTYSHRISPWFILGTQGHSDGQFREGTRSWMWVC